MSLQQDSQYLDIDYEDVELKIAMPSYENVNYNNSAKNVSTSIIHINLLLLMMVLLFLAPHPHSLCQDTGFLAVETQ